LATLDELKARVDLHALADFLGLRKGKGSSANYHSPHHEDRSPSLSINEKSSPPTWRDFSDANDAGGTCIDLVMYVAGIDDVVEASKFLHDFLGIPFETRKASGDSGYKSRAEFVAEQCLLDVNPVKDYLAGRGITDVVIDRAIKQKAVGWNSYTNPKKQPSDVGFGGPGAAFITRSMNPGKVMAVDVRYVDPALNGGVKTQCQGEKEGFPFFVSLPHLKRAHTLFVVESPINALSIDCCGMTGVACVATRGVGAINSIDWRFAVGKTVYVCMDNDEPDDKGRLPGQNAAWKIYERLTAANVATFLVDQSGWEHNDVNDVLQALGSVELKKMIKVIEPWAIAGVPGDDSFKLGAKRRVYLPPHDFSQYWRFRPKEDFTRYIVKRKDGDKENGPLDEYGDLCGFRVASFSRITVASAAATTTGDEDQSPKVLFCASVQTPRHKANLIRKVFDDETVHNVEQWKKFGPVFSPAAFSRLLSIMERTADLGERDAVNYVGLAWRKGKPVVNEGADCYFTDPDKQCPYYGLRFPSGDKYHARLVVSAYQDTFNDNAALLLLVWALGAHLKLFLGFWPHMIIQAAKGSGKSTLIKNLERSIAFTMFSGQSLQTEFRLLTSICHTSHPVGWEEISARRQDVIDKAISLLQESYNFTTTRRGADLIEYLISAPVLLAGEDVPVDSLLGKVVRTDLTNRMGPELPHDLPRFPMLQWLRFLATFDRGKVLGIFQQALQFCQDNNSSTGQDQGARRMTRNYAALLTTWRLLCSFSGVDEKQGSFKSDLIQTMNTHISESSSDREPWIWIMRTILAEISSGHFRLPFKTDYDDENRPRLIIRPSHIIHHLRTSVNLRDMWNALPVKSDRVLKQQLVNAGVVICIRIDPVISRKQEYHMMGLSVDKLKEFGLFVGMDAAG